MRPFRSFLLLLIFLACFTGLYYIFPQSNLFPAVEEFMDSLRFDTIPLQTPVTIHTADSIPADTTTIITSPDSIISEPVKPLSPFLDSLISSKGQLRVMYYGDSQIEGDRITYYLRKFLRSGRGGTGPGLFLPLMPVMYTKTIRLRSSPNWKRFNYLSFENGEISHRNLGPFMTICRFIDEGELRSVPEKAFVRITPSVLSDTLSTHYDLLRIFYGNSPENVSISVRADGLQVFSGFLSTGNGIRELECSLNRQKEIIIEFEGLQSPDIYGISIESKDGVIIDNIPQRGSAGLEFTMVGEANLRESYRLLEPDLIVLHFGLNVVNNVKDDYTYYMKGLRRQLMLLKEIAPKTSVLVIGVTDMASGKGDSLRSFENIPYIIEAQKKAASEAGTAFWDSYMAMGGEASIIDWASREVPLAQKDYVHFTYDGADTISAMLARALFTTESIDTLSAYLPQIQQDSLMIRVDSTLLPADKSNKGIANTVISEILSYDRNRPLIFTSPAFWLFFLIVLLGYSIVYKKHIIRNFYLFCLSLFFYYKSGGIFLFLLILVTIIDFLCGHLINHSNKKIYRKFFILFSIVSNLGILAYFKYTDFLITSVNNLFGTDFRVYDFLASFSNKHMGSSFEISNIILPVGISFFTFQSLSYTLDVYRNKIKPVTNILDFGFFVSFFPQLVAGPIVRASEFIPQLYAKFHLEKREFSQALFLISKGLIKKIVISDFIAVNFIDRVFEMPALYSGFENLMAVYGYGLQIYCDFSGYTDIAIGVALILGFRLPINFNSPYKATDLADFWRRWHISLSRWLKDYLYIPLGGNKKGNFRTGINLMITMLLGGLWHGAALRFIIWGGLHGMGLIISRLWNNVFGNRVRYRFGRAIAVLITFNFVSFCWIFFRADDMNTVTIIFKQIFENFSPGSYLRVLPAYSTVFIIMLVGYIIHFLPERSKESYRGLFIKSPLIAQLLIIMVMAVLLYQMRSTDVVPFIYFRF